MLGTHTCRNGSCFKRLDLPVAPYSCVLARPLRKHNFPICLIHRPCGSLSKFRMGNLCLNNRYSLSSTPASSQPPSSCSWCPHVVTRDKSFNLLSCVKSQGGIDIMPFPTDLVLLSGFTEARKKCRRKQFHTPAPFTVLPANPILLIDLSLLSIEHFLGG